MKKIRINELARELEVKAHEILDRLPELGVTEKKTHSSSIDEDVAIKLRRYYGCRRPTEPGDERTATRRSKTTCRARRERRHRAEARRAQTPARRSGRRQRRAGSRLRPRRPRRSQRRRRRSARPTPRAGAPVPARRSVRRWRPASRFIRRSALRAAEPRPAALRRRPPPPRPAAPRAPAAPAPPRRSRAPPRAVIAPGRPARPRPSRCPASPAPRAAPRPGALAVRASRSRELRCRAPPTPGAPPRPIRAAAPRRPPQRSRDRVSAAPGAARAASSSVRSPASRPRVPWFRRVPIWRRSSSAAAPADARPRRVAASRSAEAPQRRRFPASRFIADPFVPASRWCARPGRASRRARRRRVPAARVRSIRLRAAAAWSPDCAAASRSAAAVAAVRRPAPGRAADRRERIEEEKILRPQRAGTSKPDRRRSIARSRSPKASRSRSFPKSST